MATKIIKDVNNNNIDIDTINLTTFKGVCDSTYVPQTRTISGVSLASNISKDTLASNTFTVSNDGANGKYYKDPSGKTIKVDKALCDGEGYNFTTTYAKQDGTYEDMHVGESDYATWTDYINTNRAFTVNTEFNFTFTGMGEDGGAIDIDSGKADIQSFRGKTLCFNQILKKTPSTGSSTFDTLIPNAPAGWTKTTNGDTATYTRNAGYANTNFCISWSPILNHRYLIKIGVTPLIGENWKFAYVGSCGGQVGGNLFNFQQKVPTYECGKRHDFWWMGDSTDNKYPGGQGSGQYINLYLYTNPTYSAIQEGDSFRIDYVNIFDLTLMFGRGFEPDNVEDFNKIFPRLYYHHDSGTLYPVVLKKLTSTSRNQFVNFSSDILVLPEETYSIDGITEGTISIYDNANQLIETVNVEDLDVDETTEIPYIEMPSEAAKVRLSATEYTDVCFYLKWDDSEFGYVEYKQASLTFPNIELRSINLIDEERGIINSSEEIYDELLSDGTLIRRVGVLDIGTDLNWNLEQGWRFNAPNFSAALLPKNMNSTASILCAKLCTSYYNESPKPNPCIYCYQKSSGPNYYIYTNDSKYEMTAEGLAQFKSDYTGVPLYFVLKEPVIEHHPEYAWDEELMVDDYGTLSFEDTREVKVPTPNTIKYTAGITAFLDSLYLDLGGYANLSERLDAKLDIGSYSSTTGVGYAHTAEEITTSLGQEVTSAFTFQATGGSADIEVGEQGSLKTLYGNSIFESGVLKSSHPTQLITIGRNQFDGIFELGTLSNTGGKTSNSKAFRSTNFIPVVNEGYDYRFEFRGLSGTYTIKVVQYSDEQAGITYDTFSVDSFNLELDPSTAYIKFAIILDETIQDVPGNVFGCIFIRYDETMDDTFVYYEENEYELPEVSLNRVGSVYDEMYQGGLGIRRVGIKEHISLGPYEHDVVISDIKPNTTNILCSDPSVTRLTVTGTTVKIYPTGLTDFTLIYELNSPSVIELDENPGWTSNMSLDNWGTMKFVGSDTPVYNKFQYEAKLKDYLEVLYEKSEGSANSIAIVKSFADAYAGLVPDEVVEVVADVLYINIFYIDDLPSDLKSVTVKMTDGGLYPAMVFDGNYVKVLAPTDFKAEGEEIADVLVTF